MEWLNSTERVTGGFVLVSGVISDDSRVITNANIVEVGNVLPSSSPVIIISASPGGDDALVTNDKNFGEVRNLLFEL